MAAVTDIHREGSDDGWHGTISDHGLFTPQVGRYHLYIGLFCPFAHRVNLVRHLKGLTSIIDASIVKAYPKGDEKGWPGWAFPSSQEEYPDATVDKLFGSAYLHDIYFKADKSYKGRYSVPVLWDIEGHTIVNNESHEMLRWLPQSFNPVLPEEFSKKDFYPAHLQKHIDEISPWLQSDLNKGVYMAGFAPNQEVYDRAVVVVFKALNKLEQLVFDNAGPYVLGKTLTELDLLAYPTLVRFDVVYHQHFKCNLGSIRHNYPVLNNWLKNLYWNVPGFRETTKFKHVKENYTKSHQDINPKGITPLGPIPDIESGIDEDWANLRVGKVELPKGAAFGGAEA